MGDRIAIRNLLTCVKIPHMFVFALPIGMRDQQTCHLEPNDWSFNSFSYRSFSLFLFYFPIPHSSRVVHLQLHMNKRKSKGKDDVGNTCYLTPACHANAVPGQPEQSSTCSIGTELHTWIPTISLFYINTTSRLRDCAPPLSTVLCLAHLELGGVDTRRLYI